MKLKIHTGEAVRFIINIVFAVYNFVLGFVLQSFWFMNSGAYYLILAVMRISAVMFAGKSNENEVFVMKLSGILLLIMSGVLGGTVVMAVRDGYASEYHEIVMITIALYAFTKLTLAIVKLVKSKKRNRPIVKTLRSISFADAVVAIYSLQRSMLVSFGEMSKGDILIFNALSGAGMCLIIVIIGINLIKEKGKRNGKIKAC